MNEDAELEKRSKKLQKFGLGAIFISDVYDELEETIPTNQKHLLPSWEKEFGKAYDTKDVRLKTAPKVEFFNTIAQCYKDVGMNNKATETLQKCEEWKAKYSFDQPEP